METSEKNADVKLIQTFFRLGRIAGIIPLYTKKSSKRTKFCSVFYLTVLTVILCMVFIVSVSDRIRIYDTMKVTTIVVDSLVMVTTFAFILTVRIGSIRNCKYFTEIIENTEAIDRCLDKADFKVYKKDIIIIYVQFVSFHALYFAIHLYEFFYRVLNGQISYLMWVMYLPSFLKMYHQLYVINIVTKLNLVVKIRYQFLRSCLEANIKRDKLNLGSLEMEKKTMTLDQIYYVFKQLFDLVTYINILFGWQIFFVLTCTVLEVLNVINFIQQDQIWSVIAVDLAYGTIYIISTIVIVKSCDDVQTNAEKILLCCYTNQETLKGTPLENDILKFAQLSKNLLPQYSAGGFITVNQKVLSSLFSATLTYLIVIIQFDLST